MRNILVFFITGISVVFLFNTKTAKAVAIDSLLRMQEHSANDYYALGDYYQRGNPDSALLFAGKAFKAYREAGDEKGEARSLLLLADIYSTLGMMDTSVVLFYKAIEWGEEHNDTVAVLGCLKLGNTYNEMGLEDESKYFYNKVLSGTYQPAKNAAFANMGLFYLDEKKYDSAAYFFNSALHEYLKKDTSLRIVKFNIAVLCLNLGIIKYETGDYDESLRLLNKSLSIFRSINSVMHIANLYLELGKLHLLKADDTTALSFFFKGQQLSEAEKLPTILEKANKLLYEYYRDRKDYKNALQYYTEYEMVHDSLTKLGFQSLIADKEVRYNLKEKQLKIEDLEQKKRNVVLYSIIIILSLMLISIIIVVVINRRRLKHKKGEIIAEKKYNEVLELDRINRERLERVKTVLHKKSQLIESLQLEIDNIRNSEDKKLLHEKVKILRESKIITEEDWNNYQRIFDDVFPGYIKKIEKKVELTSGEKRQLIFLKLGLSQKEVANLAGISPLSVKRARQRLAKKIGLENTRELRRFLE